jgi:hypothetical protein
MRGGSSSVQGLVAFVDGAVVGAAQQHQVRDWCCGT